MTLASQDQLSVDDEVNTENRSEPHRKEDGHPRTMQEKEVNKAGYHHNHEETPEKP